MSCLSATLRSLHTATAIASASDRGQARQAVIDACPDGFEVVSIDFTRQEDGTFTGCAIVRSTEIREVTTQADTFDAAHAQMMEMVGTDWLMEGLLVLD